MHDVRPDEWDDLARRSPTASVFQSYGWQRAWWDTQGRPAEPLLLEARDGAGALVGIAPLMIDDRGRMPGSRRTVRFAGHGLLNYGDFLLAERPVEVLSAFVDWLIEHHSIWTTLRFGRILDTSPTYRILGDVLEQRGIRVVHRRDLDSPELVLNDDAALDRKLLRKQGMQTKLNRLRREGTVAFDRISDPESIAELLPTFFQQHIQRRSSVSAGGASGFLDEGRREFVERLIELLGRTGQVLLDVLWFDGRPIAFNLLLVDPDGRRHLLVLLTFDVEIARHSPGLLLLRHTLEATIDAGQADGVEVLDFSIGEHGYKYRFANRIRSINSFAASDRLPLHLTHLVVWKTRDLLRRLRRRYPELADRVKRAGRRASRAVRW
ncbi:GNAT family N-acetyltransferase [Ilumatobacter sp.]|uniref:GNAT family N-acetyltransferase n=1 Tax=Ilumatobacter sp. TaxID=1967498 RepID=UPI003AF6BB7E